MYGAFVQSLFLSVCLSFPLYTPVTLKLDSTKTLSLYLLYCRS